MFRRLRILQICPYSHPVVGGLENVVLSLATGMQVRGHEVTIFTSNLTRTGHLNSQIDEVAGVRIVRFPAWFKFGSFASLWPGIIGGLLRERFDLIHAHSYRHPHCDFASFSPLRREAKFILDPHWPEYPRGRFALLMARTYDATLGRRLFRSADLVMCGTPFEVPWLHERGARAVKVLPHGIPARYFETPFDGTAFRNRLGINRFMVLSVGRPDRSKGFDTVIAALQHVPDAQYVIIGPWGPYHDSLRMLVDRLGLGERVLFLGPVSDEEKIAAIDASDAFIQPSAFEAFGISTLEALARGKPCIGSRVGGLQWLLDGCGLVVERGDVHGVANAIRRIMDDRALRTSLEEQGRKKAAGLTWERVLEEYDLVLNDLVRR